MKPELKPIYKKVKVLVPHCPVCGEQLSGNNSIMMPFTCKCGKWEQDWFTQGFEIKEEND
jgi:hypothetical protein